MPHPTAVRSVSSRAPKIGRLGAAWLCLLIFLLAAPQPGLALGIGQLVLTSKAGEPFHAEVPVSELLDYERGGLKVSC